MTHLPPNFHESPGRRWLARTLLLILPALFAVAFLSCMNFFRLRDDNRKLRAEVEAVRDRADLELERVFDDLEIRDAQVAGLRTLIAELKEQNCDLERALFDCQQENTLGEPAPILPVPDVVPAPLPDPAAITPQAKRCPCGCGKVHCRCGSPCQSPHTRRR